MKESPNVLVVVVVDVVIVVVAADVVDDVDDVGDDVGDDVVVASLASLDLPNWVVDKAHWHNTCEEEQLFLASETHS